MCCDEVGGTAESSSMEGHGSAGLPLGLHPSLGDGDIKVTSMLGKIMPVNRNGLIVHLNNPFLLVTAKHWKNNNNLGPTNAARPY